MASGDTARRKYERAQQRKVEATVAASQPCACAPPHKVRCLHYDALHLVAQEEARRRAGVRVMPRDRADHR